MAKVLLKLQLPSEVATLDALKALYGLSDRDFDQKFGLRRIRTKPGLYAVKVDEAAAERILRDAPPRTVVRQSDPKVEAFGLGARPRASA